MRPTIRTFTDVEVGDYKFTFDAEFHVDPKGFLSGVTVNNARRYYDHVKIPADHVVLRFLRNHAENWWLMHPAPVETALETSWAAKTIAHHKKQFGEVPLSRLSSKLAEEAGEVCGAVTRHLEQRDGRTWEKEIQQEIGDTLIVLTVLAKRFGLDIEEELPLALDRFISREWWNVTPYKGDPNV